MVDTSAGRKVGSGYYFEYMLSDVPFKNGNTAAPLWQQFL